MKNLIILLFIRYLYFRARSEECRPWTVRQLSTADLQIGARQFINWCPPIDFCSATIGKLFMVKIKFTTVDY